MNIEQELEIIKKKNNKIPLKTIMLEYDIKNAKTIYDIIERNGREKTINKKYDINESYFSEIDNQDKAYWLGFLYADGYVRMKNNRSGELKLKLAIKDKHHIELFRECLESNHIIKDVITNVVVDGRKYESECSTFSVYNTRLVKDLIKHGCMNNKTFKIRFPSIREDLVRHFIRGYFDGDGYISINKNSANCGITSNNLFLNDIKDILKYGTIRKRKNIYDLLFYSKENIKNFYHFIYDDSNIYLNRKKDVFEKHLLLNTYNN